MRSDRILEIILYKSRINFQASQEVTSIIISNILHLLFGFVLSALSGFFNSLLSTFHPALNPTDFDRVDNFFYSGSAI
jgi:hypothetical protein